MIEIGLFEAAELILSYCLCVSSNNFVCLDWFGRVGQGLLYWLNLTIHNQFSIILLCVVVCVDILWCLTVESSDIYHALVFFYRLR